MANLHLDANQPAANTEAAHIQDVLSKSGADEAYKALIGDSLTQTKGMNHRDADQYRTTLGNDLEAKGILPQTKRRLLVRKSWAPANWRRATWLRRACKYL